MWSIGALLELDDRARLEKFLRTELLVKLDLPVVDESKSETIFEYFVDNNGNISVSCFCMIVNDLDIKKFLTYRNRRLGPLVKSN